MTLSPDGLHSAAVVETEPLLETEIFKFRKGCYSVAIDGKAWEKSFMNVWEPCFSKDGTRTAASVRTDYIDYTIAVDGKIWNKNYSSVWAPVFSPGTDTVVAPVKEAGQWTLAGKDGPIWDTTFYQLWHPAFAGRENRIGAIVSPKYGLWTVAVDGKAWDTRFNQVVTDLSLSLDGERAGCVFKHDDKWGIAVDGKPWQGRFEMAWKPVFGPDATNVAAKVEINGTYTLVINGNVLDRKFTRLEMPVFSQDGRRLLVRGIEKNIFYREIIDLDQFSGQILRRR